MAKKKNACILGGGISKFGVRATTFFDMLIDVNRESKTCERVFYAFEPVKK